MVARDRLASPRCAFLGIEGGLVVTARRKQGYKSARHGLQVKAQSILPIEIDLGGFTTGEIIEIDDGDSRGHEARIGGKRSGHVETGIVESPLESHGSNPKIGEDLPLLAVAKVVENHNRANLLVESVMQTFRVGCDRVLHVV